MARMKGLSRVAHRDAPRGAQRAAAGRDRLRAGRRRVDRRQRGGRDGVQLARHRPLLVQAVPVHDYPLAQGAFLLIALVLVLMNFVADLLYMVLDPRVSHGRTAEPSSPSPRRLRCCRVLRRMRARCRCAIRSPSPASRSTLLFVLVALFADQLAPLRPARDPVHARPASSRPTAARRRATCSAPPISAATSSPSSCYGARSALAVGLTAAIMRGERSAPSSACSPAISAAGSTRC